MIEKARGIVLHHIKYGDTGAVVQVYSREFGRHSLLVKGIRNKKAGKHSLLLKPLFILDLVFYGKDSRSMHIIKEFSVVHSPAGIYSDIKKSCMAVFLGEVLASVLKEETPNPGLYLFLEESIKYFDECAGAFTNFHIAFLIGLSSYLGFEPGNREDVSDRYFDMLNGTFVAFPPVHGNYAGQAVSEILSRFFSATYESMNDIPLTGSVRDEVLETILRYYSIHLPGLRKIKSLEVLKEIFS